MAGFLASLHWVLELTCHFRVQYLAASFVCGVVLLFFRDYRWSVAALSGVLLNGAVVVPWFVGGVTSAPTPSAKTFRVLLSNVFTNNRNSAALLKLIQSEAPDLVVLQEVDDRWVEEMQPLQGLFPHGKAIPRSDNFGIALWSRFPLTQVSDLTLSEIDVPSILAAFTWNGKPIFILATHPLPTGRKEGFEARNEQLNKIANLARDSQAPLAVIGDLNVTMFSPYYAKLMRDSQLTNARKGAGVLPTWPTFFPLLAIPLDHCLVSRTFRVAQTICR